jgi:hypothetical protein
VARQQAVEAAGSQRQLVLHEHTVIVEFRSIDNPGHRAERVPPCSDFSIRRVKPELVEEPLLKLGGERVASNVIEELARASAVEVHGCSLTRRCAPKLPQRQS